MPGVNFALPGPQASCLPEALRLIFIAATMALFAVFMIADTFLDMLFPDLWPWVLMATVASVVAVVVVHMTGTTFRGVVLVETEVFVVIERGRSPAFLRVTLPTVALDVLVQAIAWIHVTIIALLLHSWTQQLMKELTDGAKVLACLECTVAELPDSGGDSWPSSNNSHLFGSSWATTLTDFTRMLDDLVMRTNWPVKQQRPLTSLFRVVWIARQITG